jgi:hypothetical protein
VCCRVGARPGSVRTVRVLELVSRMGLGAQVTRHVSRLMASMPRHGGGRPPAFVASINGKKARKMLSHSAALDHESLCSLVCMHYSVLPRRRHHFDHLFH